MKKRIVNVSNERRMIPIKSKIENELHSYVLIGKSTAIIVRGRKDTDKIEYTIIDSGRIAYTQSRYREVWDNKWTFIGTTASAAVLIKSLLNS